VSKKQIDQLKDWQTEAGTLIASLPSDSNKATVVALLGDLGVGKTTFVQSIAKELGVTELLTSPTFTILKRYETNNHKFKHLIHMDAYRIESKDELGPLRFEIMLQKPETLICIEWADKIESALPSDTHTFLLEIDSKRHHTIQKLG
jgi:tRNA threonylcarbamoyladenosine biosynthesis protein TsaE